MDSVLLRN